MPQGCIMHGSTLCFTHGTLYALLHILYPRHCNACHAAGFIARGSGVVFGYPCHKRLAPNAALSGCFRYLTLSVIAFIVNK